MSRASKIERWTLITQAIVVAIRGSQHSWASSSPSASSQARNVTPEASLHNSDAQRTVIHVIDARPQTA